MKLPQEKPCSLCKQWKPLDQFSKNHTLKDGKNSACKACIKLKNQANYVKYKERYAPVYAAYRARTREKTVLYGRAYRKAKKHKALPSYKNRRVIKHRYRARKLQLPDTWTEEQLAFMLDYWHHACAICGNPKGLFWTLAYDHWKPIAAPNCPGTTAINMIPLCHGPGGCNNSKGHREPRTWLIERYGPRKAAKIEHAIATYFAAVALAFPEVQAS
jgi:hypothetical protein